MRYGASFGFDAVEPPLASTSFAQLLVTLLLSYGYCQRKIYQHTGEAVCFQSVTWYNRAGGPKLKVVEVEDDRIIAVQASNEQGEKYTLKAADVTAYKEDGDFGVC